MDELRKRFPYLNDIVFPDKAEGDQIDLLIGLEFFEWMAPYLVRYEGRGKPCVLHTLLGPVVMFGEPRKKCLESFTAPVTNLSVTVLATTAQDEQEEQPNSSIENPEDLITVLAVTPEDEEVEPTKDSPAEVLSYLWRYDLMGIDTNEKRSDKPYSLDEQRAWDILDNGVTILPNQALQIPIPWKQNEPRLMDNREEVRRDALRQQLRWEMKGPHILKAADLDIKTQLDLGFIRQLKAKEYMNKSEIRHQLHSN
jgi:hypothetical protein